MASHAVPTHALRLLIVEDDLPSARSLREMLEHSDDPPFTIRHVTSAAEACDAVRRGGIDVVVLDLGLPDATDLQALVRLETSLHEIPVIVLTGRGDESLATDGCISAPRITCSKGRSASTRWSVRSVMPSNAIAACAIWRA
ncbi:MAG TPA: response regulator [Thermoanaerobaculia bacterium]|nr:response regulator [Thermoanaerobaculia bacterium]